MTKRREETACVRISRLISLLAARRRHRHFVPVLGRMIGALAAMLEHEQPNGRGEIAVLAFDVDAGHQLRQMHAPTLRDRPEFVPENVFETDARLVAAHHNRSFQNARSEISAIIPLIDLF